MPPPVAPLPPPPPVAPTPPPPPPAAFAVVSTQPADGETAVSRSGKVAATFNTALDPATVTASSAQLLGPLGNALPGMAWTAGSEVSLAPALPALPGGTRFTMSFASSIRDKDGRLLNAPTTRSFTTAQQTWGAVSQVATMPYFTGGNAPAVAIDRAGNVTAAWRHQVNGLATGFVSRMNAQTGAWSAPVVFDTAEDVFSDVGGMQMYSDANVHTYLVWSTYRSGTLTRKMARFMPETAVWERLTPFAGAPAGTAAGARVFAVDGMGRLTVVVESATRSLFGTRFDPASATWSAPQEITKPGEASAMMNLQLVVDAAGNSTLAWADRGSVDPGMKVARFNVQTGTWSAPVKLDDNVTHRPFALAADTLGGATLAWIHGGMIMDVPYIAAARFDTVAGKWSEAVRVSADIDALGAASPSVVADAAGIATVVWTQSRGIYSARSSRQTSMWAPAARIGRAPPGSVSYALSADIAGNLMLLYPDEGQPMAIRFGATEAQWGAPAAIGKLEGAENVFANDVISVIDATGNLTAVWQAWVSVGGTPRYVVAANRYR
ncbi:Ig-like domain-containing protein [Massilia niabensis]|uniref:Ig-like domain-containing protein n=1 Tax=Massilia niabensis TaxID=544910 RepID=A0ABW0L212_9BURK